MKTLDIKWFETEGSVNVNNLTKCLKCDGTGIMQVPNGEDDFDHDFCTCSAGQHAEHIVQNEVIAHAN